MPKHKSSRGAAKRFKATASGKLKRKKSGLRHILTNKAKKTKRNLRQHGLVSSADAPSIKKLLPYL